MIFRFGITTPANTAESSKQSTILLLAQGIIHQIDVQFPSGPAGYLHLQIRNALHQVFPYNPGEAFASSNVNIRFRDFIPILEPPFEFVADTWNTDDTYEHLVIIRLGILPVSVIAPWLTPFSERLQALLEGY